MYMYGVCLCVGFVSGWDQYFQVFKICLHHSLYIMYKMNLYLSGDLANIKIEMLVHVCYTCWKLELQLYQQCYTQQLWRSVFLDCKKWNILCDSPVYVLENQNACIFILNLII